MKNKLKWSLGSLLKKTTKSLALETSYFKIKSRLSLDPESKLFEKKSHDLFMVDMPMPY